MLPMRKSNREWIEGRRHRKKEFTVQVEVEVAVEVAVEGVEGILAVEGDVDEEEEVGVGVRVGVEVAGTELFLLFETPHIHCSVICPIACIAVLNFEALQMAEFYMTGLRYSMVRKSP